jgi:class 3 adenylate cyclase
MLFTEATWLGLTGDLQGAALFQGEHTVKGRAQPVKVWTLPAVARRAGSQADAGASETRIG